VAALKDLIFFILLLGITGWNLFAIRRSKEKQKKEAAELIRSFAEEMVKENQKFLHHLAEMQQQVENEISRLMDQTNQSEERLTRLEMLANQTKVETNTYDTPAILENGLNLKNRYKDVFDLFHEGYSIDEISKKLKYGKGELELILQLVDRSRK
jgi:DNA-binding NarL/FixJ family response regulator